MLDEYKNRTTLSEVKAFNHSTIKLLCNMTFGGEKRTKAHYSPSHIAELS